MFSNVGRIHASFVRVARPPSTPKRNVSTGFQVCRTEKSNASRPNRYRSSSATSGRHGSVIPRATPPHHPPAHPLVVRKAQPVERAQVQGARVVADAEDGPPALLGDGPHELARTVQEVAVHLGHPGTIEAAADDDNVPGHPRAGPQEEVPVDHDDVAVHAAGDAGGRLEDQDPLSDRLAAGEQRVPGPEPIAALVEEPG